MYRQPEIKTSSGLSDLPSSLEFDLANFVREKVDQVRTGHVTVATEWCHSRKLILQSIILSTHIHLYLTNALRDCGNEKQNL